MTIELLITVGIPVLEMVMHKRFFCHEFNLTEVSSRPRIHRRWA